MSPIFPKPNFLIYYLAADKLNNRYHKSVYSNRVFLPSLLYISYDNK